MGFDARIKRFSVQTFRHKHVPLPLAVLTASRATAPAMPPALLQWQGDFCGVEPSRGVGTRFKLGGREREEGGLQVGRVVDPMHVATAKNRGARSWEAMRGDGQR
eukprot:767990-Hanusia_phi.AAC.4